VNLSNIQKGSFGLWSINQSGWSYVAVDRLVVRQGVAGRMGQGTQIRRGSYPYRLLAADL
jgi:hypothetical protein